MKIVSDKKDSALSIRLEGRLDTTTAPELDKFISENIDGVKQLVFDLAALDYISSAGLRTLLSTQKKMNAVRGSMIVRNPNEIVSEVFDVTGFVDILTIE